MATREQSGTNIDPGVADRVSGKAPSFGTRIADALRYVVAGVTPTTWMSPAQPIAPQVQDPEQGAVGRMFDYGVGTNVRIMPRAGEQIGFPALRALADSYDLLRLAIETRKDQVESYEWKITVDPEKTDKKDDAFKDEIKLVTEFLERPDREHNWSEWLRMVMEDVLVIDAWATYPRLTKGGALYALDLVDGATIKRVIDAGGRTPLPPSPAYQQVLKGIPAVDYTREDLIYTMRNPRTWKLYGYSPVEQIVTTVNIAIRRQISQLQFYTEGNIPEAIAAVPDSWTSTQIKDFQLWWDSLMEGNTGARRHMKFIPRLDGIVFPKDAVLKDEYDDWLARIICYAFSLAPNSLIKQVNRAQSEQVAETAKEEGLIPFLKWFAASMTFLLRNVTEAPLRFTWNLDEVVDSKTKADINAVYLDKKVYTPDEVRIDLGKPALTPEERAAAFPAPIDPFGLGGGDATDEEEPAGKEPGAPPKPGDKTPAEKFVKRGGYRMAPYQIFLGDTIVRPPNVEVNVNGSTPQ